MYDVIVIPSKKYKNSMDLRIKIKFDKIMVVIFIEISQGFETILLVKILLVKLCY